MLLENQDKQYHLLYLMLLENHGHSTTKYFTLMVLENQDKQYHLYYLMSLESQDKQYHLYFIWCC